MPSDVTWQEERAGLIHACSLMEREMQSQQRLLYAMNQMVTILLNQKGGETIVAGEALEHTQPLPFTVDPCVTLPGAFVVKNGEGQIIPKIAVPGIVPPPLKRR